MTISTWEVYLNTEHLTRRVSLFFPLEKAGDQKDKTDENRNSGELAEGAANGIMDEDAIDDTAENENEKTELRNHLIRSKHDFIKAHESTLKLPEGSFKRAELKKGHGVNSRASFSFVWDLYPTTRVFWRICCSIHVRIAESSPRGSRGGHPKNPIHELG